MPMMIQVNSVVRHSIPLLFLFSFSAIEPLTPSTQEDPCQASKRRDSKTTREISSQNAHLHVCSGICGGIPGGGAPCCTHASHHSQAHSFESKAIQGREYRLQPSPRAVPEGQSQGQPLCIILLGISCQRMAKTPMSLMNKENSIRCKK